MKITVESIQEYLESIGSDLLEGVYINAHTKMRVRCEHGHITERTWNNIKTGYGCSACAGNRKYINDDVRDDFLSKDLVMLDTYVSKHKLIKLYCKVCGNTYETSYNNFTNGKSCPHCFYKEQGLRSTFEMEVKNWLESVSPYELSFNDVSILINPETKRRLELDVLILKRGKAIEIQGHYHFTGNKKTERRDRLKFDLCKECGIDLMYISQPYWDIPCGQDEEKKKVLAWL